MLRFLAHVRPNLEMFGLDSSKHVMSSTPVGFHAGFSIVC